MAGDTKYFTPVKLQEISNISIHDLLSVLDSFMSTRPKLELYERGTSVEKMSPRDSALGIFLITR